MPRCCQPALTGLEVGERCCRSGDTARAQIGSLLDNPEISSKLADKLKAIQRAFRQFMDDAGDDDRRHHHRYGGEITEPLSLALGTLRAQIGVQIGELAAIYDVDVAGELTSIVPDGPGWFFETFAAVEGGSRLCHQPLPPRRHVRRVGRQEVVDGDAEDLGDGNQVLDGRVGDPTGARTAAFKLLVVAAGQPGGVSDALLGETDLVAASVERDAKVADVVRPLLGLRAGHASTVSTRALDLRTL